MRAYSLISRRSGEAGGGNEKLCLSKPPWCLKAQNYPYDQLNRISRVYASSRRTQLYVYGTTQCVNCSSMNSRECRICVYALTASVGDFVISCMHDAVCMKNMSVVAMHAVFPWNIILQKIVKIMKYVTPKLIWNEKRPEIFKKIIFV